MIDVSRPFVLLDDVSAGHARLFDGLAETVVAQRPCDVAGALDRLAAPGPWAGFIGYEAGLALEDRLVPRAAPDGQPLAWLGRFARETPVDGDALLAEWAARPAGLGGLQLDIGANAHADALSRVQQWITAGDIYQANFTFPARLPVSGHPLALYARLRAGSAAPFGAVVFTGSLWLLSFSPELFFRLEGRALTARPMKGTARRGRFAGEDAAQRALLAANAKDRAENLMITDLIRNDLSRVADDVRVPALFAIEAYPTVWQMTSTVTATARPGISAANVLAAMFPCGSITGAPKLRAMQCLAELEAQPRGAYCGTIGAVSANGDALFNVAIRTLALPVGSATARLGLGSGIVADSVAEDEWVECLAKSAFLHRRGPPDLIETLRVVAGDLPDLALHLDRLDASARHLGHAFDRATLQAALLAAAHGRSGRLRVMLAPSGQFAIQLSPLPPPLPHPLPVALVPLPVAVDDWRLCHKSSDREFYDRARQASGAAEVIFVRPDGLVTEGSFTSLFVERDGLLLTPPADLGLLPGILRARLLHEGRAMEARLTPADLAGGCLIGNALRGLMPAILQPSPVAPQQSGV